MSTNQIMLTLGAFLLFSLLLLSFYKIMANTTVTVNDAQAGISCLTLAAN